MANYNLKNFEAAEKSAIEAQKMDTKHRNPKIDQVLGLIMIEKRDYPAAAEQCATTCNSRLRRPMQPRYGSSWRNSTK